MAKQFGEQFTEQEELDIKAGKPVHKPFGNCHNCPSIVFRCPKCNYAINTCGDCISDETKMTDSFMQYHFAYKTPSIKAWECFNCHIMSEKSRRKLVGGIMMVLPLTEKERTEKIGKLKIGSAKLPDLPISLPTISR